MSGLYQKHFKETNLPPVSVTSVVDVVGFDLSLVLLDTQLFIF